MNCSKGASTLHIDADSYDIYGEMSRKFVILVLPDHMFLKSNNDDGIGCINILDVLNCFKNLQCLLKIAHFM